MLDWISFQKNIIGIRTSVCDYEFGVIGTRGPTKTKKTGYSTYKIMDNDYPVELIYQNHDLYLQGWRNKDMQVFIHKFSGYDMRADKKLRYGNDYGDLGLDRSNLKIDLTKVNGALSQAYHVRLTDHDDTVKGAFGTLAVAFSEAVRFADVMLQIMKGEQITDLDWDKHKDKNAVLVVKG